MIGRGWQPNWKLPSIAAPGDVGKRRVGLAANVSATEQVRDEVVAALMAL